MTAFCYTYHIHAMPLYSVFIHLERIPKCLCETNFHYYFYRLLFNPLSNVQATQEFFIKGIYINLFSMLFCSFFTDFFLFVILSKLFNFVAIKRLSKWSLTSLGVDRLETRDIIVMWHWHRYSITLYLKVLTLCHVMRMQFYFLFCSITLTSICKCGVSCDRHAMVFVALFIVINLKVLGKFAPFNDNDKTQKLLLLWIWKLAFSGWNISTFNNNNTTQHQHQWQHQ